MPYIRSSYERAIARLASPKGQRPRGQTCRAGDSPHERAIAKNATTFPQSSLGYDREANRQGNGIAGIARGDAGEGGGGVGCRKLVDDRCEGAAVSPGHLTSRRDAGVKSQRPIPPRERARARETLLLLHLLLSPLGKSARSQVSRRNLILPGTSAGVPSICSYLIPDIFFSRSLARARARTLVKRPTSEAAAAASSSGRAARGRATLVESW